MIKLVIRANASAGRRHRGVPPPHLRVVCHKNVVKSVVKKANKSEKSIRACAPMSGFLCVRARARPGNFIRSCVCVCV